jgi:hypothetical protein
MTGEARETKELGTGRKRGRRSSQPQVYAFGVALVLFFVSWAAIAARPWQDKPAKRADPRVLALKARETELRREALVLKHKQKRQWIAYERSLALRQREIAAARLRHEQEVAAAAAAAVAAARAAAASARLAAASTAAISATPRKTPPKTAPTSSPTPTPPATPLPTPPPPPPTVVELPPEVQIVELPPITKGKSS